MQNTYPTTPDFNNITNLSSLQTAALQHTRRPPASKSGSGVHVKRAPLGQSIQPPPQNINKASFASNAQRSSQSQDHFLPQPELRAGPLARLPQPTRELTAPHATLPGLSFPPQPHTPSQPQATQTQPPSQFPNSLTQEQHANIDAPQHPSNMDRIYDRAPTTTQDAGRVTPEEGELSDGELQEDFPPKESVPISRNLPSSNTDTKLVSNYSVSKLPAGSEDEGSLSSYNPPSASTPERMVEIESFQDPSNYAPAASSKPLASTNSKNNHFGSENSTELYQGRSVRQWRDLARDAVLSLIPHNIRYEDLIKEGLNAGLLQGLYPEASFKKTPIQNVTAARSNSVSASIAKPADSNIAIITLGRPSMPTQSEPTDNRTERDNVINGTSSNVQSLQPPISAQQPTSKPTTNSQNQTNVPAPPTAAPLSRKDLIAQRLAARNGKTVLNQSPETVPVPTTLSKPPSPPKAGLETFAPLAEPVVVESQQKTVTYPPPQSSPTSTNRAKSKAQTDLVRQKMELLMKQAPAKSEAQQSQRSPRSLPLTQTNNFPLPSYSSLDENVAGVPTPTDPTVPPGPSASSAFRSETPFTSQIPGLFLADLGLEELISNAKQQASMYETNPTVGHDLDTTVQPENLPESDTILRDFPGERANSPDALNKSSTVGLVSITNNDFGAMNTPQRDRQPLKRPLAADSFDDPQPPRKRPFGRKESYDNIEIVISDNEGDEGSEEVGMDLDEESEGTNRSGPVTVSEVALTPAPADGITRAALVQHMQSRQHTFQSPSSAQTPIKEKEKEDLFKAKSLEEADMKIADMKRKIAEAEARRNAKRNLSLGQTPKSSPPSTPTNHGAAEAETAIQITSRTSSTTSTPIALGDAARAEALRQKLLRKRQAQTSLPVTDDEVEKSRSLLAQNQAKLAEMREELRKREAAMQEEAERLEDSIRKNHQAKSKLVDELRQLGADVESMPIDQMSTRELEAKRNQLVDQQAREASLPQDISIVEESGPAAPYGPNSSSVDSPQQAIHEISTEGGPEPSGTKMSESTSEQKPSTGSGLESIAPGSSKASAAIAEDNSPGGVGIPIEDSPGSRLDGTPDPNGSISMSDGDSDAYEPEEPAMDDESVDSDFYEPADLNAAVSRAVADLPSTTVESQAQSEDDEAMSIDEDPYEPAEEGQITENSTNESSQVPDTAVLTNGPNGINAPPFAVSQKAGADDVEDTRPLMDPNMETKEVVPKLTSTAIPDQYSMQSPTTAVQEPALEHLTGPLPHRADFQYHPYDSPFAKFRNFRFSERFLNTVPGGYRSITYSGRIDLKRFLCTTELAGETCADPKCPDQHFSDMSLTDDKILVEMSSAKDFKDKEERDRFVAGLKQVIADLRSRGVKEFTMVANELAAYRRRFQQSQLNEVLL